MATPTQTQNKNTQPQNRLTDFRAIRLRLASPDEILKWSYGEITKPETINYRTQRPEKDGLFCERIFGPEKDYECYCGKYRKIRYKGVICDKCGVEVTRSIVRRERMGHIKLAAPVSHIWFLRGVPSKVGLFLDMSVRQLEKVVYFTSYVVISVDEDVRQHAIDEIKAEYRTKKKRYQTKKADYTKTKYLKLIKKLDKKTEETISDLRKLAPCQVLSEVDYFELSMKFGHVFEAGVGAEAILRIIDTIDMEKLVAGLAVEAEKASSTTQQKVLRRLRLVRSMIRNKIKPEWMFLSVIPVMPPDLRPMVQLDGGRFATSDVNDLYRRVINRNNRLKRLNELGAPEVIVRNEKRMLQEAVDALIDNSARKGHEVRSSTGQKRVLKSLADMLKGKQGRFRANLLGKRVDYSARSVIIAGPEMDISECGIPKKMAMEIFKPFVIQKLINEKELAPNIKSASRLIEEQIPEVWDSLAEVIRDRYVLLNRAPTLHRLSVQAFQPRLIEGSAIKLHPLVCSAFNADFDGDQMAVHVPLSDEAVTEARELMSAQRNLLKPATGKPIVTPSQDMVLGAYWMSKIEDNLKGHGKKFATVHDAMLQHSFGYLDIKARIFIKGAALGDRIDEDQHSEYIETCLGRIMFNLEALPDEFPFYNELLSKKALSKLSSIVIERIGIDEAAHVVNNIKDIGFRNATASGISWGMDDLKIPEEKHGILDASQKKVDSIQSYFKQGLLTEDERKAKVIETWTKAVDDISQHVPKAVPKDGSIFSIFDSGARGSWGQTSQMSGLKGLVVNPASEVIELPVKSSFKEGFNVLEYFISTHGARKGTTDTALKTAVAGYLTRRLVDVAQDVIVKEKDCGDTTGIIYYRKDGESMGISLAQRSVGRVLAQDVYNDPNARKTKDGLIAKAGVLVDEEISEKIEESQNQEVAVRSPISCKTIFGICQNCYGDDLSTNRLVEIGAAVGIITAQSIGEPGTQLTMRTFHAGGVAAGTDITQGLPRIEEIFENRIPKSKSVISEVNGMVEEIKKVGKQKEIVIRVSDSGKKKKDDTVTYSVPLGMGLHIDEGDLVAKGQQISEGSADLGKLYKVGGIEAAQRYMINEVQGIYSSQGASINDKYIEVIVRKMFSRVRITEPGDTEFMPGEVVEEDIINEANVKLEKKQTPASGVHLLMGITKVSLSSDSFLSAASFQETAKTLINAAIEGKVDKLRGLKENVVIGKLIPAGTGVKSK